MRDLRFTIFTPCYNGARTIDRVFRSVEAQTYGNFEWIIINDGSKDDSDAVIRQLIERSPVKAKITYIVQPNLGKHRAWNKAADLAQSDLFLCADADDGVVPETLEFYNAKANEIGLVGSKEFCGINACAFDHATKEIVGNEFPEDGFVCDNFEMVYKYGIRGDKWMCNRTDFMKSNKFPDIAAPFYPESGLWYAFALAGYRMVCYNKRLMSHHVEATSLCNSFWVKFNSRAAKVKLRHNLWLIRNAGGRILRMNVMAWSRLVFVVTLKNVGMYIGGLALEASRYAGTRSRFFR